MVSFLGPKNIASHRPSEVTVNVTYPSINEAPQVVRDLAISGHEVALAISERMRKNEPFEVRNLFGNHPQAALLHRVYSTKNEPAESADVTILRGDQAVFTGDHTVPLGYPEQMHRIAEVVLYNVLDAPTFLGWRTGEFLGSGGIARGSATTVFGMHLTTLDPKQNSLEAAYDAPVYTRFTIPATEEIQETSFFRPQDVPPVLYEQSEVALQALVQLGSR